MITTTDTGLIRLLQLCSAGLPVGGYSFSQGLEYAIDTAWVTTSTDVADWISLVMDESMTQVDLPLLQRLTTAAANNDVQQFTHWNHYALACRETSELHLTEVAMGEALLKLFYSTVVTSPPADEVIRHIDNTGHLGVLAEAHCPSPCAFVAVFAAVAHYWQVNAEVASVGYMWSWLENQIAAATKLVPLGQTSAQQLLLDLGEKIPATIARAATIEDDAIGASLPGLAMASAWHETQYSRLFRS